MVVIFTEMAWEDYLYWQKADKKMIRKINELIKSVSRTTFEGIGKPEPLKFDLAGFWSRRINHEHRLVYQINNDEMIIISCRYHYE